VVHRFNTMPTVNGKEFIGASIWASPSLDAGNNTIYVTTGNPPAGTSTESPPNPQNYSESIIALNASTLNLESFWQIPQHETVSDGDFGAGATVVQGVPVRGSPETLVVAGNKDGFVYAWNASDVGRGPLWATQTGITIRELISPAAYGGGLVYVETPALTIGGVSAPGGSFALYPNNGTIAWEEALLGRGIGAPLYADGVILAEAGQFIEVFNGVNGQIDTEIKCPSYFVSAPSIAEGYVWAGCENGMEYALELSTHTYTVKFTETGLPLHSTWGITLAPNSGSPTVVNSTTTTIKFHEPNGLYTYRITPIPGYHITAGSYSGTVLVSSSNPATISVHWALVKYTVKFEETGLPSGTNWTVTIDHQTDRLPHTSSSISFNIPNGTYPFTIAATGYTVASSPTSPITVDGASVIVAVTFT